MGISMKAVNYRSYIRPGARVWPLLIDSKKIGIDPSPLEIYRENALPMTVPGTAYVNMQREGSGVYAGVKARVKKETELLGKGMYPIFNTVNVAFTDDRNVNATHASPMQVRPPRWPRVPAIRANGSMGHFVIAGASDNGMNVDFNQVTVHDPNFTIRAAFPLNHGPDPGRFRSLSIFGNPKLRKFHNSIAAMVKCGPSPAWAVGVDRSVLKYDSVACTMTAHWNDMLGINQQFQTLLGHMSAQILDAAVTFHFAYIFPDLVALPSNAIPSNNTYAIGYIGRSQDLISY